MTIPSIMQQEIDAYRLYLSRTDSEFNEDFVNSLPSNASATLTALEAGQAAMRELAILKGVQDGQGKDFPRAS